MSHPVTWVTSAGLLGVYPSEIPLSFKVIAVAEPPYVITSYEVISGGLPDGISFRDDGLISGTPSAVTVDKTFTFVVRVNSTNGSSVFIKDRTFSMEISGEATPSLIPSAEFTIFDSIWYTQQISYINPLPNNPVRLRIIAGSLPPGLEMNPEGNGLIRGYPSPPITTVNLPTVQTTVTSVSASNNYITVVSTAGFAANRPITFANNIANIQNDKIYYIKEVINQNQFTITSIPNGIIFDIDTSVSAFVDVTLQQISVGQPSKRQYTFTVDLTSPAGNDRQNYTITVVNQNLPSSQGGPGYTAGTRTPVILNTRPPTYNIKQDSINYGYYVLPANGEITGATYLPSQAAYIGQFQSDNYFSFHVLGYDYDNMGLTYSFSNLPNWIIADPNTGWIYGDPSVAPDTIEEFSFVVNVSKTIGSLLISSGNFNFTFRISNDVDGTIRWISDQDLGSMYNGTISYKSVVAESDVNLVYELWAGSLPPNLTLNELGEIRGVVAYQPVDNYKEKGTSDTFTFTVKAYNQDLLKEVNATLFVTGERYFISSLGTTDFTTVGATQVDASDIVGGKTYFINDIGTTDFSEIGATLSTAGSFTAGKEYIIKTLGNTDFSTIGAPSSFSVGTIFTATGAGTGTGTAYETEFFANNPGEGTGTAVEQVFYASGSGTGTGTANTYLVNSDKSFDLVVNQVYDSPTDNLYIKCTPNLGDRNILATLLDNNALIPTNYLYRANDPYFGKARDIVYGHAYGIYSSDLQEYILAVQKNHYWKNVTLGQLSTAIARNEDGTILYEVVYSNVIDNLQKYDRTKGIDYRYSTSISETVNWPRFIDLNLGPWYTSQTDIYTSYIFSQDAILITELRSYNLLTQTGIPIMLNGGVPTFYTSLSPGYVKQLYPNSLDNMRNRVEQVLGANYNFRLLPIWMTSQQADGNTLGYTPAWVIAYTKPAEIITTYATETKAKTLTVPAHVVVDSTEGFVVGRPIVFTGDTFGNIIGGFIYYVKQILSGTQVVLTTSITYDKNNNPVPGNTYSLDDGNSDLFGPMTVKFDPVSYAKIIKEKIEKNWNYKLNEIDFDIDRFTVDKAITYDFDAKLSPGAWLDYPSATPTPDPIDSENFYVIFPRRNILSRIGSDEITG